MHLITLNFMVAIHIVPKNVRYNNETYYYFLNGCIEPILQYRL